ncbi:hypothetical protein AAFN60_01875 [Roseibacillus persicicus]|uniref:hypothetical protein n=1 Tax=Roseibacillus persicicus TaxID=454148 RepID=UPI00398B7FCA
MSEQNNTTELPLSGKKKKEQKRTSAAPLAAYLELKNWTHGAFAQWVGVSDSVVSKWLRDGSMPFYIGRAVELLVAQEQPSAEAVASVIIKGARETMEPILSTAQMLGLDVVTLN